MIVNINVKTDSATLTSTTRCVVEGTWWTRVTTFPYTLCSWKAGLLLIRTRHTCGVKPCWRVLVSILWTPFTHLRVRIHMSSLHARTIACSLIWGHLHGAVTLCAGDCTRRCSTSGGTFLTHVGRRVIGMVQWAGGTDKRCIITRDLNIVL